MSFRTRLALIIAGVFITAGAGLLAAEYVIVQRLFASAIQMTTVICTSAGDLKPVPVQGAPLPGCSVSSGVGSGGLPGEGDQIYGSVIRQSVFLSDTVVSGLMVWSIVLLVVFAVVAAGLAFWLARRSLSRIGEVTAAARAISERDLDRRLDLPGPNDEIKELGDTFDGMLDRLHLAFSAQNRFVANASHELRTPLTTTRAALEIPLQQGVVPAELEPAMRTALRATEQSERLITALLTLTRGRRSLRDAEPVDLDELVTESLDELDELTRTLRVKVESEVVPTPTTGNPALLERAARNLLENGIRHNLKRGGRMWVRVGADGERAFIEVENTGAVLSAETVELLTEPFYRGDATRTSTGDHDGMGLGLAIVESIALTHGGRLTLSPREEGGLVARMDFPAG